MWGRALLKKNRPNGGWLTGWKQIGAYLDVSVTTVTKYHRDHGLPVHWLPGGAPTGRPAELDEWVQKKEIKNGQTKDNRAVG